MKKKTIAILLFFLYFNSCLVKENTLLPQFMILRNFLKKIITDVANIVGNTGTGVNVGTNSANQANQNLFSLSVNVTGLSNPTLVLTNTSDDLSFDISGTKTFAIQIAENQNYFVTIKSPAIGNNCLITSPSGTMPANNLTIEVTCTPAPLVYGGQLWATNPFSLPEINVDVLRLRTVAGSTNGNLDSSNPLTAQFSQPTALTTDGINLYIGHTNHKLIRKMVLPNGAVTTIAGTGSDGSSDGIGTVASFRDPRGFTTDGNFLYIADRLNHNIRRLNISTNEVITIAGPSNCGLCTSTGTDNGIGSVVRFNQPNALTLVNGNLYILDSVNRKVRKLNLSTNEVTDFAGNGNAGSTDNSNGLLAQIDYGTDIKSTLTDLYIAEISSGKIRKINIASTEVSTIAGRHYGTQFTKDGAYGISALKFPETLMLDKSNLYVLQNSGFLRKISLNDNFTSTIYRGFDEGGNIEGESEIGRFCGFVSPNFECGSMATDGRRIYFVDRGNQTIRVFEERLILRLSLDEAPTSGGIVQDTSPNNLTATIGSGITSITDTHGNSNRAFQFDGSTNSRITVPHNTALNGILNEFSISFWINPNSHNDATIMRKYSAPSTDGFYVQYTLGKLEFCQGLGSLSCTRTNITNLFHLNVWQHIAIRKQGTDVKIFWNGSILASTQAGAPHNNIIPNSNDLVVANAINFNGGLDDIRIYSYDLSAREVERLSTDVSKGLAAYFPANNYVTMAPVLNVTHFENSGTSVLQARESRFKVSDTSMISWAGTDNATFPINTFQQFPEANEDFSACVWGKNADLSSPAIKRSTFVFGNNANGESIELSTIRFSSTEDRFTFSGFSGGFETHFNYKSLDDRWHFYCVTHEESTNQIRMYLNGSLVSTQTIPAMNIQKNNLIIGRAYGGANVFFGEIDDLRIYTRRLSNFEILALAKFGNRRVYFTNSNQSGAIGGIAGMNNICKSNTNNPYGMNNREWKFLGSHTTDQRACLAPNCTNISENINWAMSPFTTYIRGIDMTKVFTTNSSGITTFPLLSSIDSSSQISWTGLNSDWTSSSDNCSNWNVNTGFGASGITDALNSNLIFSTLSDCSIGYKLICVEQY